MCGEREFTDRDEALLRHYRLAGREIQTGKAHEKRGCRAAVLLPKREQWNSNYSYATRGASTA